MNINNKIITILVVFSVITTILFIIENTKSNNLKKDNEILSLELNKIDNKLQTFVDENGFYRAKAESAESDLKTLKVVYENELDRLTQEFSNINKNYKNLNGLYRTSLTTIGELRLKLDSVNSTNDTTYNNDGTINNVRISRNFGYNDDWIDVNGKYVFNTVDSNNDDIYFNYNVKDSLTLVSYYKRDNLFGKRYLYVEGISHNPNTKIVNLSEIKISNHKEPKISIGFQGGYGLTENGFGWYVGVGISNKISIW